MSKSCSKTLAKIAVCSASLLATVSGIGISQSMPVLADSEVSSQNLSVLVGKAESDSFKEKAAKASAGDQKALSDAIDKAKSVSENKGDYKAAYDGLLSAMTAVDSDYKSDLNELIKKAGDLDLSGISPAARATFNNNLATAKSISDYVYATPERVDDAIRGLNNSMKNINPDKKSNNKATDNQADNSKKTDSKTDSKADNKQTDNEKSNSKDESKADNKDSKQDNDSKSDSQSDDTKNNTKSDDNSVINNPKTDINKGTSENQKEANNKTKEDNKKDDKQDKDLDSFSVKTLLTNLVEHGKSTNFTSLLSISSSTSQDAFRKTNSSAEDALKSGKINAMREAAKNLSDAENSVFKSATSDLQKMADNASYVMSTDRFKKMPQNIQTELSEAYSNAILVLADPNISSGDLTVAKAEITKALQDGDNSYDKTDLKQAIESADNLVDSVNFKNLSQEDQAQIKEALQNAKTAVNANSKAENDSALRNLRNAISTSLTNEINKKEAQGKLDTTHQGTIVNKANRDENLAGKKSLIKTAYKKGDMQDGQGTKYYGADGSSNSSKGQTSAGDSAGDGVKREKTAKGKKHNPDKDKTDKDKTNSSENPEKGTNSSENTAEPIARSKKQKEGALPQTGRFIVKHAGVIMGVVSAIMAALAGLFIYNEKKDKVKNK